MVKNRISQRLSVPDVFWGVCLCALLCGGCLSTAWQEGGTDAVGLSPVEPATEWGSDLPLHRASVQVGRSLASAGDEYEYDEPIKAITNSGWRIGAVYLVGDRVSDIKRALNLDDRVLSAWGYQFQFQRGESEGTVGLVDIIPLWMGLDESMFIPAVNVLVGLRYKGWEFSLGPHFSPRPSRSIMRDEEPDPYWDDDAHLPGLGLAGAVGYWFRRAGGVNMSVDLSWMQAGDLTAIGLTFGWNFKD